MKVTLVNYTQDAVALLLLSKSTRLGLTPGLLDTIHEWSEEKKLAELAYLAGTVPSSWEFVSYVFLVEGVSRAYTHQQVRTRTGSYAQQAMRVVNMSDFDYIYTGPDEADPKAKAVIDRALDTIKQSYRELLALGHKAEDARGILPTNISTNIMCQFNLRAFADLVKSRSGGRTQSEYQHVVNAMADEVLKVHPWADAFLFRKGRDHYKAIEEFAEAEFKNDTVKKWQLLKIVDALRKVG